MGAGSFGALLEQVAHNGFMAGTAGLSGLTLFVVCLAVRRILPSRPRDDTLPRSRRRHGS